MALVPDQKFSTFQDGGDLEVGDIIVGLRGGLNTRFDYTGELPSGVVVPIANGGTGATTAAGARTNLGLGTMAVQNANAVAITGGTLAGVTITASTAALTAGSVVAAPVAGIDIANKTYVDSTVGTLGAALTRTNDTNVTLTLGGSPTTALVHAASLTLGWTGVLSLTRGGSNASLTASNGGIVYSNATQMAILAGTATARQMLQSGASTTPAWSTTTWPATSTINRILFSSAANVVGEITSVNSAVLSTSSGGVPSLSTTLPSGIAATNMNLTTPTMATINDTNGATILVLTPTASAVNYLAILNNSTTRGAILQAMGSDSNVDINIIGKNTGQVALRSTSTTGWRSESGTAYQHVTNFAFADTNNNRTVTVPDATGTLLMTGQAINSVPSITFSSTSGIIGTTTNDSAPAGSVGEYVFSSVTTQAITSNTPTNVTSISLTAGDWNIWGSVFTNPAAGTTQANVSTGITSTSATLPANYSSSGAYVATTSAGISAPFVRAALSGTTTIYLVSSVTYAISTLTINGVLSARRVR